MEVVFDDNKEKSKKIVKKYFRLIMFFVIVILALMAFFLFTVSVPENYAVCIKRFEQVVATYTEPGLHWKTPIDTPVYVRSNSITYNLSPSDVLTLDKKAMTVSSYVVWQIAEPLTFIQTTGTEGEAERFLDATVYNTIKNLLGSLDQMTIISMRGADLEDKIIESVSRQMEKYGIIIGDIRIKQFDLPTDNKNAVYNRMISEREKIAAQYRAEGKEEADKIRNTISKESMEIESEAKATAALLVGEGESEYMRILAQAYNGEERAAFYEFLRTLDALKVTMKGEKTIILPIDSPLTKILIGK